MIRLWNSDHKGVDMWTMGVLLLSCNNDTKCEPLLEFDKLNLTLTCERMVYC